MGVTFIGDVHGWTDRLEQVLAQAEGEAVLLGDLIDRGPDSRGVLRRVMGLCAAGRARCLLGNHEYALLRAIGAPSVDLPADPQWFALWRDRHGGHAVLRECAADDAGALRRALGTTTVDWLASLPWCLHGDGWLAVHAALRQDQPLEHQLGQLADGWRHLREDPGHLYEKAGVPLDHPELPVGTVLVSGHLPLPEPLVSPRRILCDTTGGLPGRRLSGVIWPSGRVIRSDG